MYIKALTITSLAAAATAAALPQDSSSSTPPPPETFNLVAEDGAAVNAALSNLFLDLPSQNATCNGESDGKAVFTLRDGAVHLYNDGSTPEQTLFVDRSGMGQGKLGYLTSPSTPGSRFEQTTFSLNDETRRLSFNNLGFRACPNSFDGARNIWVDIGIENPGGSQGCVPVVLEAVAVEEPVSCQYS